jgi:hypothetical protein
MPKKAKTKPTPPPALPVFVVRGQRVILDADLAAIYGVPTFRFNEAIKRNRERFPADFAFQLTAAETDNLKSQFATSSLQPIDNKSNKANWSQIATSSEAAGDDTNENLTSQIAISRLEHFGNKDIEANSSQLAMSSAKHRGKAYRPWAFTEHGAVMAANLLRSERAVRMSVFVVRAFVGMREQLAANAGILRRLAEVDKTLLEHDQALKVIWADLQPLLAPPPEPPRRRIGFHGAGGKT